MEAIWNNVTADHVLKAIDLFNQRHDKYSPARNTFLIYNDQKYPAKYIRGLAYTVAFATEISRNEYSGGQETVDFFSKLGFTIEYKGKVIASENSRSKL